MMRFCVLVFLLAVLTCSAVASDGYEEFLMQMSADDPHQVRAAARQAGSFGEKAVEPMLNRFLVEPDSGLRMAIVRGLGAVGVAAEAGLIDAMQDTSPGVRETAVTVLASLEPVTLTAVEAVAEGLRDTSDRVRAASATALGAFGGVARPAAPQLVLRLGDTSFMVVRAAERALPQIVSSDDYPTLLQQALDTDAPDWESGLRAVAEVELEPWQAVEILVHGLQAESVSARQTAARLLHRYGHQGEPAIQQLMVALDDRPEVSFWAVRALGANGEPALQPIQLRLQQQPDPLALEVLGWMGTDSAARIVVEYLFHPEVAKVAKTALIQIGEPAINPLLEILHDEQPVDWQVGILRTLADIDGLGLEVTDAVAALLTEELARPVQFAAIDLLAATHSPVALLAIVPLLQGADELVRVYAARALGVLGPEELSQEWQTVEELGAKSLEFYVSPQGNDAWSGTLPEPNLDATDGPFRTFSRATAQLLPGDVCTIRAGVYREVLRPVRSGAPEQPITFRSYPGEEVILSGTTPVTDWQRYQGNIYKAPMDWNLGDQNQIFVDGEMMFLARWPSNTGTVLQPDLARVSRTAIGLAASILDRDIPEFEDPDFWRGAKVWCVGGLGWVAWTVDVVDYDPNTKTLHLDQQQLDRLPWGRSSYYPQRGDEYVLMGTKALLNSPGEWWYDEDGQKLYLWAPDGADPNQLEVEAKFRTNLVNLAGRQHIHVDGLQLVGGGIVTDSASAGLVLKNLRGRYINHSYAQHIGRQAAIVLDGHNNEINSCEFAYSSGNLLHVSGSNHRIINSYFHHGNYHPTFGGLAQIVGDNHLISHNTFRHAGRDVLNIGRMRGGIIEHNVLSDAGWLTRDLGMTYGHNFDFANLVIRYNWIHDNHARAKGQGIYFDHVSRNVIIHDNVIWNVRESPIRINGPSYYVLMLNNTMFNSGTMGTFDPGNRDDLFGSLLVNNVLSRQANLPASVVMNHNIVYSNLDLRDVDGGDFRPQSDGALVAAGRLIRGIREVYTGVAVDVGAYAGEPPGHNFSRWIEPEYVFVPVEYMNLLQNSCFDGSLEHWQSTGHAVAGLAPGNDRGVMPLQPTATGRYELVLSGEAGGVTQQVHGLEENRTYRLAAWVRVSHPDAVVTIRASGAGLEASSSTSSTTWVHQQVHFKTGPGQTSVDVNVEKESDHGRAYAAHMGLQLTDP